MEQKSREYVLAQEAEIALLEKMSAEVLRMVPPVPSEDEVVKFGKRAAVLEFARRVSKRMDDGVRVRKANIQRAGGEIS